MTHPVLWVQAEQTRYLGESSPHWDGHVLLITLVYKPFLDRGAGASETPSCRILTTDFGGEACKATQTGHREGLFPAARPL